MLVKKIKMASLVFTSVIVGTVTSDSYAGSLAAIGNMSVSCTAASSTVANCTATAYYVDTSNNTQLTVPYLIFGGRGLSVQQTSNKTATVSCPPSVGGSMPFLTVTDGSSPGFEARVMMSCPAS